MVLIKILTIAYQHFFFQQWNQSKGLMRQINRINARRFRAELGYGTMALEFIDYNS